MNLPFRLAVEQRGRVEGLLLAQQVHVALNPAYILMRTLLLLSGPLSYLSGEPVSRGVLLFHPLKQGQDLLVNLPAGQPQAWLITRSYFVLL